MASCNVLMYKIVLLLEISIEELVQRLENIATEETRVIIDYSDSESIAGTYVYSEISKSREYNFENNNFETVTQKRYIAIEFHINKEKSYLDIWGSKKGAQRVVTAITLALDNKISIEAINLDFYKIINFLKEKTNIYVNKVVAYGVVLEKELLADCSFNLEGKEKPFVIIDKYIDKVKKVVFKWEVDNRIITIVLYKSGVITIHTHRHLLNDKTLDSIYTLMLYAGR